MNKRQYEVQKKSLEDEKETIQELKKAYEQARKDCEEKILALQKRSDTQNLQSIIYQKRYQQALKKQLDTICDALETGQFETISDYLIESYENGYTGVMYDLQGQGIPVIAPINQKNVLRAVETDSKISQGLYERMGEDVQHLKKTIRSELSRGIANGSDYGQIAKQIAWGMNSPFNKAYNSAIRIARTEGHRIQQRSALDALHEAKKHGADVVKQWDSTMDGRTRPTHRELDGQIVEIDEKFVIKSTGASATAPGAFGDPAEDCNCRCCLLQRAKWALDEEELDTLKKRAEYFELDKTESFEQFEKKYLDTVKKTEENEDEEVRIDKLEKIRQSGMSKENYEEYLKIINEHKNTDIKRLYADHADKINGVNEGRQGYYQPSTNSLVFSYPKYSEMNKFGTLAHEYGHYFDEKVDFGLSFKEIEAIRDGLGTVAMSFKKIASSSDEFLDAVRKDKELLKSVLTDAVREEFFNNNASSGVQDAVDGLFPKSLIRWGHGEKYYNRKYSTIKNKYYDCSKDLQTVYKSLGLDASSQAKTKVLCRQYEAASEMWANIMSAEVCGGKELEYVKQYLPNSYAALKEIIKRKGDEKK